MEAETEVDEIEGFGKVLNKFCTPGSIMTQSYSTFGLAVRDCRKNEQCVGIYEKNCDGQGEFHLCEEIDRIYNGVLTSSCVYTTDQGKMVQI